MTDQPFTAESVPETAIGIVESKSGQVAKMLKGIRYAGVHQSGHRFTAIYSDDVAYPVMCHLLKNELTDYEKSFSQKVWVVSDDDVALTELNGAIPTYNAALKEYGYKGVFQHKETALDVFDVSISEITRGKSEHHFNVTMTGTIALVTFMYAVSAIVNDVDLTEYIDLVNNLQAHVNNATWSISVPASVTAEEWVSNNWVAMIKDWYHDTRYVFDVLEPRAGRDGVFVCETRLLEIEDGKPVGVAEHLTINADDLVYTNSEHAAAVHYNSVDNRYNYASTLDLTAHEEKFLSATQEGRDIEFDDLMTRLRAIAPQEFHTVDSYDMEIENAKSRLKSLLDSLNELENGMKAGHIFLWQLNGSQDSKQTSEDGVLQVATLANLKIDSPNLACEWAEDNAPEMAIKTIDKSKAVKRIRADGSIPDGCTRTETVYGKIIKGKLLEQYSDVIELEPVTD